MEKVYKMSNILIFTFRDMNHLRSVNLGKMKLAFYHGVYSNLERIMLLG